MLEISTDNNMSTYIITSTALLVICVAAVVCCCKKPKQEEEPKAKVEDPVYFYVCPDYWYSRPPVMNQIAPQLAVQKSYMPTVGMNSMFGHQARITPNYNWPLNTAAMMASSPYATHGAYGQLGTYTRFQSMDNKGSLKVSGTSNNLLPAVQTLNNKIKIRRQKSNTAPQSVSSDKSPSALSKTIKQLLLGSSKPTTPTLEAPKPNSDNYSSEHRYSIINFGRKSSVGTPPEPAISARRMSMQVNTPDETGQHRV